MENKEWGTGMFKFLVFLVDSAIVVFSIYISFLLLFNFSPRQENLRPFIDVIPFIVITYLLFMYIFGLNDLLKRSMAEAIYSIFLVVIALLVVTSFVTFFARGFAYPRSVLLLSPVIQFILLSIWRVFVWKINRKAHGIKDSMIIGEKSIEYLTRKILTKQKDLYNVKYICNGNSKKIDEYLEKVKVVFLCDDVDFKLKKSVLDYCLRTRKSIYIIPDMYDIALRNSTLNRADDIPILKVKKLGLTLEQKILKRILDIVVSLLGIIVTSPIMIIVVIAIKLSDGGNIFYKQERVTEGNRNFNVLKFRTMVMNAEQLTGPVLAGDDDPRITKIGKILRATRIDELPQFFNILFGDMSVVGPRPERPFFVEQFKEEIPDYKFRTIVKAGLTGLAQVLGKYSTTPEDKVRYDILYVRNYSIFLDLKLILQTIKIMFMKESSEGVHDDEEEFGEFMKEEFSEVTIDLDDTTSR